MKVIREGDKSVGQWWIGRTVTCGCGAVYELEEDEHLQLHWSWMSLGNDKAIISCQCCAAEIKVKK